MNRAKISHTSREMSIVAAVGVSRQRLARHCGVERFIKSCIYMLLVVNLFGESETKRLLEISKTYRIVHL